MRIFCWTRGRIEKQKTRRNFYLDQIKFWPVTYVVPECERVEYQAKYPGSDTVAVPDYWNASQIRHWLTYSHDTWSDPFHVLMDDDLVLLRRFTPTDIRQRSNTTLDDAVAMFKRIEDYMVEGYKHGGISIRSGNNRFPGVSASNTRVMDIHFYDARVFVGEKINLAATPLMGDFHATLSLLELGYENVLDCEFMSGQQDHAPGGCSRYRTVEMLAESARKLAEIHVPFVKLRDKTRKNPLAIASVMPDVTVYWKKSFCSKAGDRKMYRS